MRDENLVVDINWLEMLKFSVASINRSEEVKELMFAVLQKNKSLAQQLFKWIRDNNPSLCDKWTGEFTNKVGEAVLEEGV